MVQRDTCWQGILRGCVSGFLSMFRWSRALFLLEVSAVPGGAARVLPVSMRFHFSKLLKELATMPHHQRYLSFCQLPPTTSSFLHRHTTTQTIHTLPSHTRLPFCFGRDSALSNFFSDTPQKFYIAREIPTLPTKTPSKLLTHIQPWLPPSVLIWARPTRVSASTVMTASRLLVSKYPHAVGFNSRGTPPAQIPLYRSLPKRRRAICRRIKC